MTWVANFFEACKSVQRNVLYDFPEDKRRQGYGRAAKIIVDGPEGGIFEVWFCEEGIQDKPADVETKNSVYMKEETLLDLITPKIATDELVELVEKEDLETLVYRLYPRLDFRTALANGLITVDGDRPDVDSEEWSQIIEKFLLKIAFPIVVRGLVKKRGRK